MSFTLIAEFAECFGSKSEQKTFYRAEFYKTLRTWRRIVEADRRIRISMSLPAGSIPMTDLRLSLKAASKLPYTHRGGRPHIIPEDEISDLSRDVGNFVQGGETRSRAIALVAAREAVDPRTLKKELKKAGCLPWNLLQSGRG